MACFHITGALTEVTKIASTLSIIIFLLSLPLVAINQKHPFPKTIPIGAIFHKDAVEVEVGFNYAIVSHKESEGRETFELEATVDRIDVSNSYELTRAICSRMEGGVFALFGMKNMSSLSVVQSLSRKFHMPYLSPSLSKISAQDASPFELHMKPSMTEAMLDLIVRNDWDYIYYVYDSDTGLLRLQELYRFKKMSHPFMKILPRRLKDVYHAHDDLRLLDRIDPSGREKVLVVDLSDQDRYQAFLRQIAEVGMNKYGYHYLLGGLGFTELKLDKFRHGGVNITGFQLLNYSSPKLQDFLNNWKSLPPRIWPGAGQNRINYTTALMIDAIQVFVIAIKRMISQKNDIFKFTFRRGQVYNNGTIGVPCRGNPVTPWIHGIDIMEEMKKVDFEGLTGHVAFDENGLRRDYTIGVYELGLNYGPEKAHEWNSSIGLNGYSGGESPDEGSVDILANRTYRVTTILTEPYLMLKSGNDCPDKDGKCSIGNFKYEGYCADLAEAVAKQVPFEYELRPVKDKKYGSKKNGSWNGMIGELVRGEADLAIADLTITVEREKVVDFSKPFMDLGISIQIKRPQTEKPGVFSFMAPLSRYIWMCIIFAYVGVSVGLFVVSRLSPYEWKQMMSPSGSVAVNEFDIPNSFWFSLGALMQQGSDFFPRSISGRVIGSVWWFFTLIIISSYTANLAAFLTIERMTTPIESADDLVKQTEIAYGTIEGGSTENFFRNSKIPTYQRMWAFMNSADPPVSVTSTKEGVEKVKKSKGKYAFLVESTTNEYVNNRLPCNTMIVGTNLDAKSFGIATPSGSGISEKVSMAILNLMEDGSLTKMKQKWWYDKGECGPQDGSSKDGNLKRPLSLSNVAGIFFILIGGLALSMVVGLFELLLKSRMKKPDNVQRNLHVLLTASDHHAPPDQLRSNDISTIGANQHKNRSYRPPPPERENGAFASDYPSSEKAVSTFTYGAPRLIGFEPLQESVTNSHTQVLD